MQSASSNTCVVLRANHGSHVDYIQFPLEVSYIGGNNLLPSTPM